jgi:hypothetical protein
MDDNFSHSGKKIDHSNYPKICQMEQNPTRGVLFLCENVPKFAVLHPSCSASKKTYEEILFPIVSNLCVVVRTEQFGFPNQAHRSRNQTSFAGVSGCGHLGCHS